MINFFTVDLEFWHSWSYLKGMLPGKVEDQFIESTEPLAKLLEKHSTSATFFVLGEVAKKYPEYIKSISERGHEIACHGYSHKTLAELGHSQFSKELAMATAALRKVSKRKVVGFRAPSFSLDRKTSWLIDALAKQGYKYDSSLFPVKVRIKGVPDAVYGMSGVPKRPYFIGAGLNPADGGIIEFPIVSCCKIPVVGGFYHRAIPTIISSALISRLNNVGVPVNFWIHTQETYPKTPMIRGLPIASKLIRYYNIRNALKKTEALLKNFKFGSIQSQMGSYP